MIRKKGDFSENNKPLATVATSATHALKPLPLPDSECAASVVTTRYSLLRFDEEIPTVAKCSDGLLQINADFQTTDTNNNNDLASTVANAASVAVANQNPEKIELSDNRRFCRQCENFSALNRYCLKCNSRQIDDIPRHCSDFKDNGLPAPIGRLKKPPFTE
ncbi:hypothetical protein [Methyloglobulus sp.]|uniref:hypothetical protein n=1 Tax=Methyloglobulus sp. TaxID=2518622 RepID=UPI0039890FDA